ncbi:MAG: DUF6364 family protein [archaeon YNP-WB-062]|jgi:hypothetical protein|nr:DUF6364 family protein [Candidatus Culexarchaeum yellowstonense]
MDKRVSLRINEELWRKAKILAAIRGVTLKSMIEELLKREIEAERILKDETSISEEDINLLMKKRIEGLSTVSEWLTLYDITTIFQV